MESIVKPGIYAKLPGFFFRGFVTKIILNPHQ